MIYLLDTINRKCYFLIMMFWLNTKFCFIIVHYSTLIKEIKLTGKKRNKTNKRILMLIKRVFINYLFTTMQKEFITGLRLKNSLSNQLVNTLFYQSKLSFLWTAKMSNGTLVVQPYTQTVIWVMQGIFYK